MAGVDDGQENHLFGGGGCPKFISDINFSCTALSQGGYGLLVVAEAVALAGTPDGGTTCVVEAWVALTVELLGGSADVDATPPNALAGHLKLKFFFCCLSMAWEMSSFFHKSWGWNEVTKKFLTLYTPLQPRFQKKFPEGGGSGAWIPKYSLGISQV